MSQRVKLPVWGSVKLTFQWSLYIVRRHWWLIAIYVLVFWATAIPWIGLQPQMTQGPGGCVPTEHLSCSWSVFQPITGGQFLIVVFIALLLWTALVMLALITHHEVLRGPAGLNAETLGKGAGRVLGYFLDFLRIWFVTVLAMLLVFAGIAAAGTVAFWLELLDWMFFVLAMSIFWLALAAVQARLLLRLPSRALGQVLPWREVQRMGRGNTWRLVAASTLLYILLTLPATLITSSVFWLYAPGFPLLLPVSPMVPPLFGLPILVQVLLALANGAFITLDIVVWCVFLSILYSELRPVLDEPDPNLPPMA